MSFLSKIGRYDYALLRLVFFFCFGRLDYVSSSVIHEDLHHHIEATEVRTT